jgi:hypothetical protein
MFIVKTLIMTISLLLSYKVFATGLQHGNEYQAHILTGTMYVTCNDGRNHDTATIRCRGNYLSPAEFTKFVTDSGIDADKVTLTYKDHKGKMKSKSSSFNSSKGESKKRFNLWIGSLFQRPMLNYYGENKIGYKLTKNDEAVEEGSFIVNVEKLPTRTCRYRSYYSSNVSDCRSGSSLCDRYFKEQNYCR